MDHPTLKHLSLEHSLSVVCVDRLKFSRYQYSFWRKAKSVSVHSSNKIDMQDLGPDSCVHRCSKGMVARDEVMGNGLVQNMNREERVPSKTWSGIKLQQL